MPPSMVFPAKKRAQAFYDKNAIQFFYPDHSENEDRFILLGMSFKARILVVCHCCQERESVIRLLSARRADREEEQEETIFLIT